jgi:hypothetical protein
MCGDSERQEIGAGCTRESFDIRVSPRHIDVLVKRVSALILVLCFLAIGTGLGEYLHNLQHAIEDSADAIMLQANGSVPAPRPVHHDESNCRLHALLHAPIFSAGYLPLLVCLGFFVAFLTQISPPLLPQRAFFRIDCRGPPVCC